MIICKMLKEDVEKVQDIAKQSWNATYEGIIPYEVQESFLNVAYSNEMMDKRLSSSYLFVAEDKGQVVGFANFSPVDNKGKSELNAVYLYPTCQSKGTGTALLQKGIEEIQSIKEIYLEVEKENMIGKSFYEAKGFKTVKEYDDI